MQIYLVGGAVRDGLLGLPVTDRDWVVVGATPQQMVALGYRPVGRDFPVFLHPRTHEEYALARTERKTAPGYRGFAIHSAPDVTLEQDLARRDLTINAMAVAQADVTADGTFDCSGASVVDPWSGRSDLHRKVLRHVTQAFREDPVRVLRVARFAARFSEFQVAPETLQLMQVMVAHGEAQALVAERVWQELARGLMEARPSRMCEVMRQSNAWLAVLPELAALCASAEWQRLLQLLDHASDAGADLPVRFACLCLPSSQWQGSADLQAFGKRLRVPADCQALAQLLVRELPALQVALTLAAADIVSLLERCDALRKPARFGQALQLLELFCRGAAVDSPAISKRLLAAQQAARAISTEAVASAAQADGLTGEQVGKRIRAARITAVAAAVR